MSEEQRVLMLAALDSLRRSGCDPRQAALALVCTLGALLVEGEQPPPELAKRMSHIFWSLRLVKLENERGEAPGLN